MALWYYLSYQKKKRGRRPKSLSIETVCICRKRCGGDKGLLQGNGKRPAEHDANGVTLFAPACPGVSPAHRLSVQAQDWLWAGPGEGTGDLMILLYPRRSV